MCTHARRPPSSSRTEIASSKSFAVSGSIVNVVRPRRSTRPSSDGSGGEYGSKSARAPVWTSSPSSTASMSPAFPNARSTRARPRPVSATTRSPEPTSPSPLRSSTRGTPGTKYGSPTTSLPRFATSTTTRSASALDLQEAADRQARARRAEREADRNEDERVERERDRVHVAAAVQRPVQERRQNERLAEDQQYHGAGRTPEATQQSLEHERAAHEPVGRADE